MKTRNRISDDQIRSMAADDYVAGVMSLYVGITVAGCAFFALPHILAQVGIVLGPIMVIGGMLLLRRCVKLLDYLDK